MHARVSVTPRSLTTAMECTKKVTVTCNVGDVTIDFVLELNQKLLTDQQLYCPIPECDFYRAKKCITSLSTELWQAGFNANRRWCEAAEGAELLVLDDQYDWSGVVDDVHNLMCQEKQLCR